MTTHERSPQPSPQQPQQPPNRPGRRRSVMPGHRLETVTVVWWVVGLLLAVGSRQAVGAAVLSPQAINHGLFGGLSVGTVAGGVVALAAVGTLLAVWMRWGRTAGLLTRILAGVGTAVVLLACLLLVDATVLAGLGYLPAMAVTSLFSAEVRESFGYYVEPGFLLQVAVLGGAVLLAMATVRFLRRGRGACARCGRRHDGADPAWTTPAAAARWGKVAALAAAAIPAFYGLTRIAWALGIPLGYSAAEVASMRGVDLVGPIGLGSFALLGAVLTLGLYQRWGDVFPRWMVGLAGRRVPVGLAVVPATAVSVAVLPAGISMFALGLAEGMLGFDAETWGAVGPAFLWPLWSLTLGAATYAYWLRRRGTCGACGLG